MKLKPKIISALVLALLSNSALALEPFVIKDIRVEGLQRTEAGTVFNYLPSPTAHREAETAKAHRG